MARENLREYRIMSGMTQKEFARRLGYGSTQYTKIELGRVEPSPRFIARLKMFGNMTTEQAKELTKQ